VATEGAVVGLSLGLMAFSFGAGPAYAGPVGGNVGQAASLVGGNTAPAGASANKLVAKAADKADKQAAKADKEAAKDAAKADKEAAKDAAKADKEAAKDAAKADKQAAKDHQQSLKNVDKTVKKARKAAGSFNRLELRAMSNTCKAQHPGEPASSRTIGVCMVGLISKRHVILIDGQPYDGSPQLEDTDLQEMVEKCQNKTRSTPEFGKCLASALNDFYGL